tara:strand:+ start:351 stop:500 length:150 start_codon:yes stop_codon:yes gene_type:complete
MYESKKDIRQRADLIRAARIAATLIIAGFFFYWVREVHSVIELLRLAYG